MKKLFAIIMTLLLVVSLNLSVYAVESDTLPVGTEAVESIPAETDVATETNVAPETDVLPESETDIVIDETIPEVEEGAEEEPTESVNIFNRLYEFVMAHKTEILAVLPEGVLMTLMAVWKKISNKSSKLLNMGISGIDSMLKNLSESFQQVINAVNGLIDKYNEVAKTNKELAESNKQLALKEDARNKLAGAELITSMTILDSLQTVYANSKNLPQGVKDLVNLKYAKCLEALEDDDKLREVVNNVRKNITADMPEPTEKDSEV